MITAHFFGLNLYFGINLLVALVCLGVAWLILDAWTQRHSRTELIKAGGFGLLSAGFMLRAAAVQTSGAQIELPAEALSDALRLAGYCAAAFGQLLDPIMKRPAAGKATRSHHGLLPLTMPGLVSPLAAALVGFLYWRRATAGLEHHLKPVAYGFAGFTLFEVLNSLLAFQSTANPKLYQLVATFGIIWWLALAVLVATALMLGNWLRLYLTKRLQSELFMALMAQAMVIFIATTIGFTYFLLQAGQKQAMNDLATAGRTLRYAITSQQAELAAHAEAVSSKSGVTTATVNHDAKTVAAALANFLPEHHLTSLQVIDGAGQVLYRGEDPERYGDSRSNDPLVRLALIGETSTSIVAAKNTAQPSVTLVAVHPMRDANGNVVGAVISGRTIAEAFVDGIHAATGLDSTIFSGDVRAATTLLDQNGRDRAIGLTETSSQITAQVLQAGRTYTGLTTLQNQTYLASYAPLTNSNNEPVGMLLIAKPAADLYQSAYQSIQLIFKLVIMLAVLMIYPIFRLSRYLSRQI